MVWGSTNIIYIVQGGGGRGMTDEYLGIATLTVFEAIKAESKIFSRSIKKVSNRVFLYSSRVLSTE